MHLGPDLRRGLAELDGQGETVGGVVVMRHGQNALRVIDGVKAKLREVERSLPPGVEIDRPGKPALREKFTVRVSG